MTPSSPRQAGRSTSRCCDRASDAATIERLFEAKFAEALKTIRAALDESEAAFTDIEKDETLIASKFAKTGEGEDAAEGDEGAKPDDKKKK